ncbi:MAG: hypothetical protein ACT4P5_17650 [Armatimonadota bacterium]
MKSPLPEVTSPMTTSSDTNAELWWIFATVLFCIFLVKASRFLVGYYFTFGEFIYGIPKRASLASALIRYAIPFLATFFIFRREPLSDQHARLSGYLASFLLLWPVIMYPQAHFPFYYRVPPLGLGFAYVGSFVLFGISAAAGSRARRAVNVFLAGGRIKAFWNTYVWHPETLRELVASAIWDLIRLLISLVVFSGVVYLIWRYVAGLKP